MKPPFSLVPSEGSLDTAKCVAALAEGVKSKTVIGLGYVVIYAHRNYEVHLCGEAARSPTFTRGAVHVLDDRLRDLIHGGK